MNFWAWLVSFVSAEWLLKNRDNGGSIIALRSMFLSSFVFLFLIALLNLLDPNKSFDPSWNEFRENIFNNITWFGVLFGSTYAALYSRFSSQWSYLANLYNKIKQSSCSEGVDKDTLAEWKAGFIEDAEYLHLAHKANFVSIIKWWGDETKVKEKYIHFTPGGKKRHTELMTDIKIRYDAIVKELEKKYK